VTVKFRFWDEWVPSESDEESCCNKYDILCCQRLISRRDIRISTLTVLPRMAPFEWNKALCVGDIKVPEA
jgi:hypothetical protein